MFINRSIRFILKIYLLALSVFSVFRIMLFLSEFDRIDEKEVAILTIFKSFIMGVRFDIVISGYILILPTLIFLTLELIGFKSKSIKQFFFYWIYILFTIAFTVSTADIPYFNQFYDRFSVGAFEWMESYKIVISMIFQEPKYFLFIIPFILLEIVFYILLKKIFEQENETQKINFFLNTFVSLIFLAIVFLGIRGRIEEKSPIRIGTAYFSNNSFLNKLGLNPSFTLIRSYLDSKDKDNRVVKFMDDKLAIEMVQKNLGITKTQYNSPIAREVQPDTLLSAQPNVVLIIMESMSAAKMKRHGSTEELTPFLDSLSHNSIYFENIYTAGKHTFNGIFSTLFSFPALYRQHSMKTNNQYDGISTSLLKNGYSTTYFTTHDSQFDNIEGFLRSNNFQNVISQSDYPASEVKTTLGVPDDFMFRFSIPKINELSERENPFFVTFMTTSDHSPFYVPEYFQPKAKAIESQIVQYADWSLQQFIQLASKEAWFNNTIFVFVADHGAAIDAKYDISLNYFHTPLIIYAPEIFKGNQVHQKIGSQIDVYPTVMGLIKQKYVNNTLGIDLLNEERKFTIINDDDKVGILDTDYLCIMKNNGAKLELYKYKEQDKSNYFDQEQEKALEMADYAKSNMQVHQIMISEGRTTLKDEK
ncbi:sulfatase-like hydrolase/transferase [Flavobacteriaceae bacterium]|jgi:phosphoglycerol transferase MdoB-like AlkP superfamily enzyme|nr:sulfatase-like hydrolase/transferase [Flavobacteriaceae bacterium]